VVDKPGDAGVGEVEGGSRRLKALRGHLDVVVALALDRHNNNNSGYNNHHNYKNHNGHWAGKIPRRSSGRWSR